MIGRISPRVVLRSPEVKGVGWVQEPSADIGTELLFENDLVRVWEMRLEPGQTMPYHVHRSDYVIVYVTPSRIALMETPGKVTATQDYQDGYVNYVSVPKDIAHQIRNEAATEHRQILVELKKLKGHGMSGNNGRVSRPI